MLANIDWSDLYFTKDINYAVAFFTKTYLILFDILF